MAVSVDSINAITRRYFIPKLVEQVITSMALLMRMKKNGRMSTIDGGVDIRQPVYYSFNTSSGWYAGSETLSTNYVEKKTALVFDWKQFYVNITIAKLDELKNAGEAKVIDHVKSEIEISEATLKDRFATGLFSDGSDTKEITGARVFGSVSNTYGGISQSSNSWLQAQVDSTTTTLSIGAIQTMFEAASEDNDQPTILVSTGTLFNSYYAKLQPQQRFTDGETASGGFKNLLFNGAPFVVDSHCPTGNLFGFNEKYLTLYSHKDRNFPGEFEDFLRIPTQDSMFGKIWWAGEFVCSSPRKQFRMSALTS